VALRSVRRLAVRAAGRASLVRSRSLHLAARTETWSRSGQAAALALPPLVQVVAGAELGGNQLHLLVTPVNQHVTNGNNLNIFVINYSFIASHVSLLGHVTSGRSGH